MNSEFSELSHTRYRRRSTRRRVYVAIGLLLIAFGYFLMGVSPGSSVNWALTRVLMGIGCVIVGFGMAVLPLLSSWSSGE